MQARRKWWGWGLEGAGPSEEQARGIAATLAQRFGVDLPLAPEPRLADLDLPAPRLAVPTSLAAIASQEPYERARHAHGQAYRDVVRAAGLELPHAPDWVAFPRDESQLRALLDWCSDARAAAIPYGGGTSVVGGVEPRGCEAYAGVVSIDLSGLDRVLEIDRSSRAARIQAGVMGPALEDALRPHGLTLRHFPQSFEFSSLGGWIATRSGGHYATLYTHIDDFVESLRVITPSGVAESRRLPGSGAGPSPDRLWIGSEGTLGIIVEAWMRLQDRPRFRASASVGFPGEQGFLLGARAVRALSQAGLFPSNCRLLSPLEAATSGAGSGREAVLVLGFESADHPPDARMARALELCRDAGGAVPEGAGATRSGREGAAGAWRRAFLEMPYVRDVLVRCGAVAETFETAIPWSHFEALHEGLCRTASDALRRICGAGSVSCRFTHVYPDGPAPYYSVLAPGRRGSQLEMWDEIKAAVCEALDDLGGSITHHHAVGRDHRPGYDRQRPDPFARVLRAAKRELDPQRILNPGVLIDP